MATAPDQWGNLHRTFEIGMDSRAWPTLLEHAWRDAAADSLLAHSMECATERGTPPNRTILPHGRKHSGAGWVAALRDQPPPGESTPTGRGRSTARRVCRSGLPALSAIATSLAHLARPDRQARHLLGPVSRGKPSSHSCCSSDQQNEAQIVTVRAVALVPPTAARRNSLVHWRTR